MLVSDTDRVPESVLLNWTFGAAVSDTVRVSESVREALRLDEDVSATDSVAESVVESVTWIEAVSATDKISESEVATWVAGVEESLIVIESASVDASCTTRVAVASATDTVRASVVLNPRLVAPSVVVRIAVSVVLTETAGLAVSDTLRLRASVVLT